MCAMNSLARRHVYSHRNRLPVNERHTYETPLMIMTFHRRFYANCLSILICNAAAMIGGCCMSKYVHSMSRVCDTASLRERVCERGISFYDAVSL